MKTKYTILCVGLTMLTSGCISPYVPLTLTPSHAASREGKEAPMYQASTTLDEPDEDSSSKDAKQKNSTHSGHNMKSTSQMDSSMGGMNHAGH